MHSLVIFSGLNVWLNYLILIAGAVGAIGVIYKLAIKPIIRFFGEVSRAVVSINGYDEVKDPATGAVLQDKTPPLANRVRRLEDVIVNLVDVQTRLAKIEEWQLTHDVWAQSEIHMITKRIDDLAIALPTERNTQRNND